jgi:protein ImuB
MTAETAVRTLVVWCPDWPLVAAGVPLDVPAAVLHANRVVACTPAARSDGVAIHQRRRDAQARCPELVVVDDDPARSARAFEPVVAALATLTPRIEVLRPGCCAVPTRGPSRYHGGDLALARTTVTVVANVLPRERGAEVQVGVADGRFAAILAARMTRLEGTGTEETEGTDPVLVVPPGQSRPFLAPFALRALDRPELVDVLRRLGLRTLGDLAALPTARVVGRFGAEGMIAQRLARGLDERPPATSPSPPDLQVVAELDPPAERLEAAAFVARGLADDLYRRLTERGSACTRLLVGAETEHGERHERLWRTEGVFGPSAIVAQLRWQLDGWLQQGPSRPTGGITRLWLVPDDVVAAGGRQLSFPAGHVDEIAAAERAGRALARAQGMVGFEAVLAPEWRGGRSPGERVVLVPAEGGDLTEPRPAARSSWVAEPWPGAIPAPAPALVHPEPLPANLLDEEGQLVRVSGRGELGAVPVRLQVGDASPRALLAWAGPWPCDERWWDGSSHRRRARMQVVTDDATAYLLVLETGRWSVEATYD